MNKQPCDFYTASKYYNQRTFNCSFYPHYIIVHLVVPSGTQQYKQMLVYHNITSCIR